MTSHCAKNGNHPKRTMKCLKYHKKAGVATNVNCIARCEAEKAQAGLDARNLRSNLEVYY